MRNPHLWKQTGVVLTAVSLSALLAFALQPYLQGQAHFLPFTLAIIASAWYGGLIAGLAATILSFLTADFFFVDPTFHFLPIHAVHVALFGLYLVVGVSISVLQNALSRSNARLSDTLEQLQQAMQRFELATQQAEIGVHEYSPKEQKQIWTQEMEHLFGIQPGTFEGTFDDWVRRIHSEDRERIVAERTACIESRQRDWKYEYRARMPDGSVRWLEGRSRLFFSASGDLTQILGVNIDVTERRNLEQTLREHSERLTRSNEELEWFAYAVSHDLKEPLRGITAMTELFLQRTHGNVDKESLDLLNVVLSSAERMRRLIQEILELARVNNASSNTSSEVDAGSILHLAIRDLAQTIQESGAKISADSLPVVRANDAQLLRLFHNLLSNAMKYRGQETPRIHVSASSATGEWIFCVSDNGIGIEPAYHERIFEMFRRLHSASEYEGTGLGLAICKRIVQRHNGRIWVDSQVGKGSRFYFALPKEAANVPPANDRKPAAKEKPGGSQTMAATG